MLPTFILTRSFAISALFVGAAPLAYAAPIDTNALAARIIDERSGCCMPNGACGCLRSDSEDTTLVERTFDPKPLIELPTLNTLRFDKRMGCWIAERFSGCLRREDVELTARAADPEPTPEFSPELVDYLRRAPEPEPHVNPDVFVRELKQVEQRSGCYEPGSESGCTERREEPILTREPAPEPEPHPEPIVQREPALEERSGCWMPGRESGCM